jgi:hypothetical protein
MRTLALLIILLVAALMSAQDSAAKPPWDSMKFFVGDWRGSIQGEPGHGTGERHYEFVLRGTFLRATNKSIYPPQEKNPKAKFTKILGYTAMTTSARSSCSGNFM